jgi:hypothetical protein
VDPAEILPYLTGPVGALAVLIWVVWMQRQDIRELRRALDAQTTRANSAEDAARTTLATINALAGRNAAG